MLRTGMKFIIVLGLALTVGLTLAPAAAGQARNTDALHNAHRLGGATAFYTPPMRTVANLKQMLARKGMADDIRMVLRESGIPETADAVIATLAGATSSVKGGSCSEATPADGVIVECDVQPGTTLLWMAYRPNIRKGIRTPGRIESVRWAGNKPFRAFLFRVTNDYRIYTFIVPMVCGNVSLMSISAIEGEAVNISVDRVCDPKTGLLRATIKATSKDLERVQRVSVAINGQPAGELTAPSWTLTSTKPGDYTFDATDTKGRPYLVARRTIPVEACPPPPPAARQVVGPTCSVVLSFIPVKGAYEINVDATRSTTGASGVAPAVTVELRDDTGIGVAQTVVIDNTLNGKVTVRRPGTYRATATVSTPQGVDAGAYRYEGTATCEASVVVERPVSAGPAIFFDLVGGKERHVRPIENTDLEFAQCSPLIGLKVGLAKRFRNDWEVGGAVGVAISLAGGDDKVRESALFVDAEVNKYLSGGSFLGTGLSLWDLTRGDTFTPAWLLHFGVPLAKNARYPVYFIGESRLFLHHIDDIPNNYQFWFGVRIQFQK